MILKCAINFVDEEAILRLLHLFKNKESRYRCSNVLSHKDKPEKMVSVSKRYFDNEAALDLRFLNDVLFFNMFYGVYT